MYTRFLQFLEDHDISLPKLKQALPQGTDDDAPSATTTTPGLVKQAAARADVLAAPTMAEFNDLLAKLRSAGVLAP